MLYKLKIENLFIYLLVIDEHKITQQNRIDDLNPLIEENTYK